MATKQTNFAFKPQLVCFCTIEGLFAHLNVAIQQLLDPGMMHVVRRDSGAFLFVCQGFDIVRSHKRCGHSEFMSVLFYSRQLHDGAENLFEFVGDLSKAPNRIGNTIQLH